MSIEKTEVVIVGGGQAGLATSEHLGAQGVPHLVLERGRIAERWRSRRWDSLVANGPAWHDRFPTLNFEGEHPDSFPGKARVAEYFEAYAEKVGAPVRCGVDVETVRRNDGRSGFRVETSEGSVEASFVVAATGPFQTPAVPPLVPADAGVTQLHSADYRNPAQLPEGGVLVVGAGASGAQIAEELLDSGRRVHLSVGPHDRPPRAYRGRDYCWWLGVLGKWDIPALEPGREHVTIAVSGANGGHTVDYRRFAATGMTLHGRALSFDAGVMRFASDLADSLASGDANYLSVLDEADAYVERNGLDLPPEPEARTFLPDPDCVREPLLELDLAAARITTILWATGYTTDYGWLQCAAALDDRGQPSHRRGISGEPGVYFVGLPWLTRRASSFIWGVWHDAKFIADHIVTQRNYLSYR